MSIFKKINDTEVKIEETKDILGGGGLLDTDAYTVTITQAYVDYAASDAMSVTVFGKTDDGQLLRSTQYVTSGKTKGCKNYYVDRNGKNQYLPGYALIDDICQLTLDTPLAEVETETKGVSIRDFDLKKDVMQEREVLVDLIGQRVILAVNRQIVDKNVKNDAGKYEPSGETREENEVVKAYHPDYGVTVTEAKGGLRDPEFLTKWTEKNKGKVFNKSKGAKEGATPGAPSPAAAAPAKSLFS